MRNDEGVWYIVVRYVGDGPMCQQKSGSCQRLLDQFSKNKNGFAENKEERRKTEVNGLDLQSFKKKTRFQPQNVRFELQKWTTILAGKNNDF